MKKTQNRRVIILSDLNSDYFEQAVFYIKAGANLIMTNTFAANEHSMGLSSKKVDECVRKGIEIARSAIDKS